MWRWAVATHGYGALGRLSASSDGSAWGYDGDGNLLVVTRPSGAAPQIARRPHLRPDVAAAVPISLTYAYANPDGSEPSGWRPNEAASGMGIRAGG